MAALAYTLCFVTAISCAVLLTRAYRVTGLRLLSWSAWCFWGLSVANALTLVDLYLVPEQDLYAARLVAGVVSMALLVYGLVWESST